MPLTVRPPKTPVDVSWIKNHDLYGVMLLANGESSALSDDALAEELSAAEDFYERDLSLRWKPTRVFSDVFGRQNLVIQDQAVALPSDFDNIEDIDEPAYDYGRDYWIEDRWGWIDLNYRPVREITQMFFAFPGATPVQIIPKPWIRIDAKFGRLQLVPNSSNAILAALSAFVLGIQAVGKGLPQSIYVDYKVGFDEAQLLAHHRDLLKGLRLRTVLGLMGIITSIATPGGATSDTLGLDGLSHGKSFGGKYGAYSGRILRAIDDEAEIRESWRRRERGLSVAWM